MNIYEKILAHVGSHHSLRFDVLEVAAMLIANGCKQEADVLVSCRTGVSEWKGLQQCDRKWNTKGQWINTISDTWRCIRYCADHHWPEDLIEHLKALAIGDIDRSKLP